MKKLLVLTALTLSTTGLFGQGNIFILGAGNMVWDAFTGAGSARGTSLGSTIDLAVMFGSTASTPLISGIAGTGLSAGANGGSYTSTNGLATYSISTAWTDILTDPNFSFVNGTNTAPIAIAAVGSNGSFTYNGGLSFSAPNLTGGTTYRMFFVAWNGAYATPSLAQAAGAALGWSQYFNYTPTIGVASPAQIGTIALAGQLGVLDQVTGPVPEPSTMALAALGGASLLLFRRRK